MEGEAAKRARDCLAAPQQDAGRYAASLGALRTLAREVDEDVSAARGRLRRLDDAAAAAGFRIEADGSVVDVRPSSEEPDRPAIRADLEAQARSVLALVQDIDSDASQMLAAIRAGDIGEAASTDGDTDRAFHEGERRGGLDTPGPPEGATQRQVNAWWSGLSQGQRDEILRDHPDWVGNLAGVTSADRHTANLRRLDALERRLRGERDRMQVDVDNELWRPASADQHRLDKLNDKLADITAIRNVLDRGDDRGLLLLRESGHELEAITYRGDLDNADHVLVATPGTSGQVRDNPKSATDLEGFDGKMSAMGAVMQRQLEGTERSDETFATVSYFGNDFPNEFYNANSGEYATNAAPSFASQLRGIDASHNGDVHRTAFGHSYGSLMVSEAMQQGAAVDDVVFTGSPGLDVHGPFDSASLGVPPGHAYLLEAEGDRVANLGRFGDGDPSSQPGLDNLSTAAARTPEMPGMPSHELRESTGHSEYDSDETTSQWNITAVATGSEGLMIR